jgi:hypothetical protein
MAGISEGQELVELVQVRRRDLNAADGFGLTRTLKRRGRFGRASAADAQQDGFDVIASRVAAHFNRPLDVGDRMFVQQVQDANVVLGAAPGSVLFFQSGAEFAEQRRQLPAAKNVGMVQRGGTALQRVQVMTRIENLLVLAVGTWMGGDHLAAQHDLDSIDVALDRHRLKGGTARHAVAVVVEARHLVLVDLGRLHDAGIEGMLRQRQGALAFLEEALANGLGLTGLDPLALAPAAVAQVGVEFGTVVDLGNGRGPIALQIADPALDAGLLLGLAHHAEERLEGVVAGQGLIAFVQTALAAGEQVGRDGAGIVPPDFMRHGLEEGEGFDQTVQDRLGAFAGQGDGEGTIRVSPGRHQDRHQPAAIGEIDVDVTEVALQTLTRIVVQWDECLR